MYTDTHRDYVIRPILTEIISATCNCAGKTTIANKALEIIEETTREEGCHCLGLDLDVAIPQWMKDNFSKGIYPTLKQRQEVALTFCDYVELCCQEARQQKHNENTKLGALVSFSFVNTDLRDIFRERFHHARWVLVDTSAELADERISQRKGHFYGGKKAVKDEGGKPDDQKDVDNSDWNFAPVTFPHDILDGTEPVDINAQRVSEIFRKSFQKQSNVK